MVRIISSPVLNDPRLTTDAIKLSRSEKVEVTGQR